MRETKIGSTGETLYRCTKCGKFCPAGGFFSYKSGAHGLDSRCKWCHNIRGGRKSRFNRFDTMSTANKRKREAAEEAGAPDATGGDAGIGPADRPE